MKTIFACLGILAFTSATALGANGWGPLISYWSTDEGDDGVGIGGKITTEVAPNVQLEFRATWFEDLAKDEHNVKAELEVIPLELGLAVVGPMGQDDRFQFLAGGGIGYYLMDGKVTVRGIRSINADPDNDFGFYAVGGFTFSLNEKTSLFAELMYRMVSAENIRVGGDDGLNVGDADLDGLGVNAGILLSW